MSWTGVTRTLRVRPAGLLLALVLLSLATVSTAAMTRAGGSFDLIILAFEDLNGDGIYGLSPTGLEPPLAGIEIRLYEDQPPLRSRGAEDRLIADARTNEDGYVVFRTLPSVNYLLAASQAKGLLPTTPLEQWVTYKGDGQGALLEYMFGQLQRSAFAHRFIFPVISIPR